MASHARRQLANAAAEPLGANLPTVDNVTGILQVVTWILLVITILTILVQVTTSRGSFYMTTRFNVISAATLLFCIGQAIAVSLQNHYGFGKHVYALTSSQINQVLQAKYAGEILYILAIYCTKLLFVSFLFDLSPAPPHRMTVWGIGALITAWTVTSFFVVVFQCQVPDTWNIINSNCINETAFWTYYNIIDMLTDAFLVVFSIVVIFQLQIPSMTKKLKVSGYFSLRIFAIAAAATQTGLLRDDSRDRTDITFHSWPVQIATQVAVTVSVLVSAMPLLRPFMTSLESGMIRVDDLRRQQRQESYTNTANFTGRGRQRSQPSAQPSEASGSNVGRKLSVPSFQPLQEHSELREKVEGPDSVGSSS